jgi:hypothetical protein
MDYIYIQQLKEQKKQKWTPLKVYYKILNIVQTKWKNLPHKNNIHTDLQDHKIKWARSRTQAKELRGYHLYILW